MRHLLVADQPAGVLERVGIGDPGQEQLGPVVVQHRRRPGAVAGPHLGQVLPDRHELDPVRRTGRGQPVELGQRGDVRRLVEHDEERRVERAARTGGLAKACDKHLLGQRA